MPRIEVNGVGLHYTTEGEGPPLVFVHGSWSDHGNWGLVAPLLADSFEVIRYDRRNHSRSDRSTEAYSRRDDEDDLAALIEAVAGGPAHVVATSFGGLVALGLTARRPDLVVSVSAHEAPVSASADERGPVGEAQASMDSVVEQLEGGDLEGGTRRFVEEVALGPGGWELLPEPIRATFLRNAPAFVAERSDPDWAHVDLGALERFPGRIRLTKGESGPVWVRLLTDRLAERLPRAETETFAGAGHAPHLTHPGQFAASLRAFLARDHELIGGRP